jgi:hypothetical protein
MALNMGGPSRCWESPGRWIQRIQLVYDNSFSSVWQYEESFYGKKIDWKSVVGDLIINDRNSSKIDHSRFPIDTQLENGDAYDMYQNNLKECP